MPLFDEFADARAVSPAIIGAIQLSKTTGTHVGVTPTLITRPANTRLLTLRCESGTIRFRPDDYRGRNFNDAQINGGAESIAMTAHGFETGAGPFQITYQDSLLVPGTSVIINETLDRFERADGSWFDDGFQTADIITLTGSASNDGDFTVASGMNVLNILVEEDIIVGEGAQTDLVMTSPLRVAFGLDLLTDRWIIDLTDDSIQVAASLADALAGTPVNIAGDGAGRSNIGGPAGWAPAAVLTLNKTDGYGSVALVAGEQITIAAPAELTIVGLSASDACSYWFGR